MSKNNIIEDSFYEKPTTSNRCLQADTALNHNCLIRSLGNEVGRRSFGLIKSMGVRDKIVALDIFSQKLINSGHSLVTVRNILVSGIEGFKRRVARCEARNINKKN